MVLKLLQLLTYDSFFFLNSFYFYCVIELYIVIYAENFHILSSITYKIFLYDIWPFLFFIKYLCLGRSSSFQILSPSIYYTLFGL